MAKNTQILDDIAKPINGNIAFVNNSAPRLRFLAGPYVKGVNDSAVVLRITGATIGTDWELTIASDGGGADVVLSGTVADEAFDFDPADLTGLNAGNLSASYTEDSGGGPVEVATATSVLTADVSDARVTVDGQQRVTVDATVRVVV